MIVRSSAYVIPHTMKTLPKVISDPEICHGKPTIQGTRIMVWQILEYLESGQKAEAIYGDFPTLPKGSIESALHYAAQRAKFELYVSFDKHPSRQIFA